MSEVTRAEQLADWLDRCKLPYDPQDVADCSAELRRLSAVEARQSELLQQEKEALILMIRTHDEPAETLLQEAKEQQWLAQTRSTLSAINEWEKSK